MALPLIDPVVVVVVVVVAFLLVVVDVVSVVVVVCLAGAGFETATDSVGKIDNEMAVEMVETT